ncbi:MAG: DNA repair protein RadA [Alphaproteobacteria bacterium]|nr:DNA repair protein RadA [Alphaproteobacteria bacterium]
MAKPKTVYVCRECQYQSAKPLGRCFQCKAWGSFVEQALEVAPPAPSLSSSDAPVALKDVVIEGGGEVRHRTGVGELDNVLGGGLVAGSLVLLGGDPGVGKSTLLLMALDAFARRGLPVLYVTGEESLRQVRMRADRLGVRGDTMKLLATTDFPTVERAVKGEHPLVVVVDSVQTMAIPELQAIPGSMSQIREVAHRAMVLAKSENVSILLVGHVTKSGELAGPKVLEHFVDTVLQFEGDGRNTLRILRSVKNRFGPAGELGMFEMEEEGLREVPDASARLLSERREDAAGTAVIATLEGSRPLLVEVQALVGRPTPSTPGRTCVGIDRTRVQMLIAVLEKAGMSLHDRDVFVNAAGGVRLEETAADLGVVAATASSLTEQPVRRDTLVFGEVGLVGEVRAVSHPTLRLKEAARHGFSRVIAPPSVAKEAPRGLDVIAVRSVREVLAALF